MADKVRMTSLMSIKRLGFGLKRVWTQTGLSSICSPAFPCCSLPHLPIGDRDAVLASVDRSICMFKSGMQERDTDEQDIRKDSGISLQSMALINTNIPYKYV